MKIQIKLYNGDCIDEMKEMKENSIDLVVTSPPYNVGIDYNIYDDNIQWCNYYEWCKKWLSEIYRVLKYSGRIALNLPYEINMKDRGGRKLLVSEYYSTMKKIGFNFNGIVDLNEVQPHRIKLTAWGSWLSPSSPYIYNPKECVLLMCKGQWKKLHKGKSFFNNDNKKEFQELVYGMWEYSAETRNITKANFSLDIPLKAIKILSWENDIVLDPFVGGGTTAVACKKLNRNFIGFDIDNDYIQTAKERLDKYESKNK